MGKTCSSQIIKGNLQKHHGCQIKIIIKVTFFIYKIFPSPNQLKTFVLNKDNQIIDEFENKLVYMGTKRLHHLSQSNKLKFKKSLIGVNCSHLISHRYYCKSNFYLKFA